MDSRNKQLSDYLVTQRNQITDKLTILGHPDRLAITALLLHEPCSLQYLRDQLDISKTTLANHLTLLTSCKLLIKQGRGLYKLESSTVTLLEYLVKYQVEFTKLQLQRIHKSYLQQISEVKVQKMNTLEKTPKFQSSWITYAGAFAGLFQVLGEKYDTMDILAYSGYAFLSNVSTKGTHIAAPTATEFFKEFDDGIASLGYRLDGFWDEGAIFGRQHLDQEKIRRLNKLFEFVKNQLDHGNPVILWGLAAAEFGIITGYQEEEYEVSTYRSIIGQEEKPIHYTALESPGGLWGYTLGRKENEPGEQTDKDAIKRGIIISKGNTGSMIVGNPKEKWEEEMMDYISGPQAFSKWAQNIEKGDINQTGHSYVLACYTEGRAAATAFFEKLLMRYSERSFTTNLKEIGKIYNEIYTKLNSLHIQFPFPNGNQDKSVLENSVEVLRSITPLEEQAIEMMEDLLENWK